MKKKECQIIRKEIAKFIADVNRMTNNGQVYTLASKWEIDPYIHLPTIEIEVKGTHVTRPFIEQLQIRVPAIAVEAVCIDEGKLFVILSLQRENPEAVAGAENDQGKEVNNDSAQKVN